MDKQVTYTLKLAGEGLELEREVSPEIAHAIVRLVFGGDLPAGTSTAQTVAAITQAGPQAGSAATVSAPDLSIREYLQDRKAKRIPDQIACIALYLKKHRNASVFTSKDLVKSFEDAQEPVPKNLARDIAWTARSGWIARKTGTKNSYYLTGTGETAVSSKFPADMVKKTKGSQKPRKKQKKTTPVAKK